MFTVVIPTIWKSEYTLDLLSLYQNSKFVKEIVLINNAPELTPDEFIEYSKIVHYKTENIYVNPAWNLGVEMAKNENILISNDDLIFDVDGALEYVLNLKDYSVIGVNANTYKDTDSDFSLTDGHFVEHGWGCLIFIKKSIWIPIPGFLKIWFGDDWIVRTNPNVKSMMFKGGIKTKMSTSSNSNNLVPIIADDVINWNKLKSKLGIK